jgi:hypothetical protein
MQEASTGKKRVDKLDWMYAAPSQEGGALGGARIGDREMEEYLLGKRRVDEVLAQGDKNVSGNSLLAMFVGLLLVLVWSGMAKKEEAGFLVRVKTASGTGTSGEVRGGRDTRCPLWTTSGPNFWSDDSWLIGVPWRLIQLLMAVLARGEKRTSLSRRDESF